MARNPQKVNDEDELFKADITDRDAVFRAVQGAQVVYLVVGFKYNLKVWKKNWPAVMAHVIEACLHNQSKLVFFDNVYAYSKDCIPHMTEDCIINPPSAKGLVRAQVLNMLMDAIKNKGLKALVARSADFYGPGSKNGLLNIGVTDNFKKGKKAFWLSDINKIHSLTFTPDAAKATALLGNTEDAYGQVWHLPTSAEKLTGKELIALTASAMNIQPRYYTLSKLMIGLIGTFSPVVKELKEMQYQNDRDYFFDSTKFENRFGIKATPYHSGIRESVKD